MSIRIRGSKFLADFMVAGKRYRRSFNTAPEASEWEATLRKRLALGQPVGDVLADCVKSSEMSLSELLNACYMTHWSNTKNERHQLVNMRQLERYFGSDTPASTITTTAVDGFTRSLEERSLSPSTINSRLSTLSKAFSFGVDRGYIANRPKLTRSKVNNNARLRYFTDEDERGILDALESDGRLEFKAFFVWCLDTGMRPSEARALSQSAVRFDE